MVSILAHAQNLVYTLLSLMPSVYQQENLETMLGLFLEAQGYPLPQHSKSKSPSKQDKTLLNLRTADVPQKVKDRAEVIRLNADGWYVEKIAAHFNWTPQTVREVLH